MSLIPILLATACIALISFTGLAVLALMKRHVHASMLTLVALSAGAMLGNAFFHLLPEGIELALEGSLDLFTVMLLTVGAFVASFLFEQFFSWHHCHDSGTCDLKEQPYAHLVLYSDAIHNFLDGLIIAAAFSINVPLGITTAFTIALHEIPQELGDFAVLMHGGFSKMRAAIFNGLAASTVVLGGVVGYLLTDSVELAVPVLIPLAAGSFIYIAAADLLPELRHNNTRKGIPLYFLVFLTGLAIMILSAMFE